MVKFKKGGVVQVQLQDGSVVKGTISERNRWHITTKTSNGPFKFSAKTLKTDDGGASIRQEGAGGAPSASSGVNAARLRTAYIEYLKLKYNNDIDSLFGKLGVSTEQLGELFTNETGGR